MHIRRGDKVAGPDAQVPGAKGPGQGAWRVGDTEFSSRTRDQGRAPAARLTRSALRMQERPRLCPPSPLAGEALPRRGWVGWVGWVGWAGWAGWARWAR